MEAYLSIDLPSNFWAGLGGDLATGMANTTDRYNESSHSSSQYHGKILQEIADITIGDENPVAIILIFAVISMLLN